MAAGSRVTLGKYTEGDKPVIPAEKKGTLYLFEDESTGYVELRVRTLSENGDPDGDPIDELTFLTSDGYQYLEKLRNAANFRVRTAVWTASPVFSIGRHILCPPNTVPGTVREVVIVSEVSDIHYLYVDEKGTGDVLTIKIRTNSLEEVTPIYSDFVCPNNASPAAMLIEVRTLRTSAAPFPILTSVWKQGVRID